MSSLAGKVVLLTGASSGIGAVTAAHLAQFKPRLVLVGIGMEGLMETSRQCQKNGVPLSQIVIMEKDLTNDAELEVIVQTVLDKFGQLDILINNAGVAIFKDIANTKMADWDRMTAINMRVPFLLTKLCLPHLIKTKGCVINVSSVQAQIGMPQTVAYAMTKAAVDHFSRTLASDVARHGVRVNTVSPGFTRSPIHRSHGMSEEVYQEYMQKQASMTPMGRVGEPIDIAKVIGFLASDDAAFVTGETIRVDGGRGVAAPVLEKLTD